jgi:four helix bundle protein
MPKKLDDLQVYQLAMDMGERNWDVVASWTYFEKDTIGKQLTRAADSVAANISEGFGRYFYKENKQFCYYSRGSLSETKTWLKKSFDRKLIEEKAYLTLADDLETLGVKLNNYIKSIGKTTNPHE